MPAEWKLVAVNRAPDSQGQSKAIFSKLACWFQGPSCLAKGPPIQINRTAGPQFVQLGSTCRQLVHASDSTVSRCGSQRDELEVACPGQDGVWPDAIYVFSTALFPC